MRRYSRELLLVACLTGAAGISGCGEDFDPFNRLTSLRVLAIKSEPATPGPGETATLSALVYVPSTGASTSDGGSDAGGDAGADVAADAAVADAAVADAAVADAAIADAGADAAGDAGSADAGEAGSDAGTAGGDAGTAGGSDGGQIIGGTAPVSFRWSWCPFPGPANEGYPCTISEADLQTAAAQAGMTIPPYDLGTAPTASLKHALNPLILQQLCAGVEGLPQSIDCEGGFPIQVKLTVTTPTDQVVSVRTLRLRFDPAATPNANPDVLGLAVRLNEVDIPIDPTPSVTLKRAEETLVKATVPLTMAEMYQGKDDNMKPAPRREQLTLTWFVETGTTDEERTRWVEGGFRAEKSFENKWEPERRKDYGRDTSRVIVVIRDERGGVGWRDAAVRLEATP